MSANSAARAARFIFRPISAASAGGVSGCTALAHRIPNAALAAAAYRRHMSELVPTRRAFLVDTLALVRGMEAQGVESKHAEAITSAISVVLIDSLENVTESLVSKGEMQKSEMIQDANLSKLKSEVQSSQVLHLEIKDANLSKFKFKSEVQSSQDHHFSLLQRANEKLRRDIDLLYRRIHYELAKQNAETTKQIAEVSDRITEASDRITKQMAEASDQIIKQNDELTKQIAEARDRITKQITKASDRINKQIAEANDRLSKKIAKARDRTTKLDREVIAPRAQLPVEIHRLRALLHHIK